MVYILVLNLKRLIRTKGLSVTYGDRKINFPDLRLNQGDQLLLIGKSGSGKTSLLNLIGGLISPSSGTIEIDNKDIYSFSKRKLDLFRGKNIGFVFQTPHFIKSFDVKSNLKLSQYLVGENDDIHLNHLLMKIGLKERSNDDVAQLSEGEKQRISIVRALINKPKIILADEPTSALDDQACSQVIELLIDLTKENNTILIIVTHDKRLKDKFKNQIELNAS